jgi:hypothetical protein
MGTSVTTQTVRATTPIQHRAVHRPSVLQLYWFST